MAVLGSYAYVAEGVNGLQIIDISDPSQPVIAGLCDTPGTARAVSVSGNYAFVTDVNSDLQIIDISDSNHPVLKKTYTSINAQGVAVAGG